MRGNATRSDDGPSRDRRAPERGARAVPARRSEHFHLRNYDARHGYDLDVRVLDDDGLVFSERYYLPPGGSRSELDAVDPGVYEVAIRLDNGEWESTTCCIGADPRYTALVELGNGIASLTEGIA